MSRWEVEPRSGVGPIVLGMTRRDVRKQLGSPSAQQFARKIAGIAFPDTDHFYDNALQITYAAGEVDFIGVSADRDLVVTYRDVSLFDVLFRDAARWLTVLADVAAGEPEFPATWILPAFWLCLYRTPGTSV